MSDSIPRTPSAADYIDEAVNRDLEWLEADDPMALFDQWLKEAGNVEVNDPNAMSLATVDEAGLPDVRIVLLKGLSEKGFDFYTNSQSAKGQQLSANPNAALCFHWKSQQRQVRVRGSVNRLPDEVSDHYFSGRARGSRVSAWASKQSRPAGSRQTLLDSVADAEARFEGKDVPRPPHWFGFRLVPNVIEFWQSGAFRLHDRIQFTREADGWAKVRLYP